MGLRAPAPCSYGARGRLHALRPGGTGVSDVLPGLRVRRDATAPRSRRGRGASRTECGRLFWQVSALFSEGLAGRESPALWGEDAGASPGRPGLARRGLGGPRATAACEVSARGQGRAGVTAHAGLPPRQGRHGAGGETASRLGAAGCRLLRAPGPTQQPVGAAPHFHARPGPGPSPSRSVNATWPVWRWKFQPLSATAPRQKCFEVSQPLWGESRGGSEAGNPQGLRGHLCDARGSLPAGRGGTRVRGALSSLPARRGRPPRALF